MAEDAAATSSVNSSPSTSQRGLDGCSGVASSEGGGSSSPEGAGSSGGSGVGSLGSSSESGAGDGVGLGAGSESPAGLESAGEVGAGAAPGSEGASVVPESAGVAGPRQEEQQGRAWDKKPQSSGPKQEAFGCPETASISRGLASRFVTPCPLNTSHRQYD